MLRQLGRELLFDMSWCPAPSAHSMFAYELLSSDSAQREGGDCLLACKVITKQQTPWSFCSAYGHVSSLPILC